MKQQTDKTIMNTLIASNDALVDYVKGKPTVLPFVIYYLGEYAKNKLLNHFCESGDLEHVKYLYFDGANMYADNDHLLCVAVENGHLDVVEYLISQGADIHTVKGWSLCVAIEYGHLDVVKYLVEHGAGMHAVNEWTLRKAIEYGHLDIVEYLISKGANIAI